MTNYNGKRQIQVIQELYATGETTTERLDKARKQIESLQSKLTNAKSNAKKWIDANCHDGEDRYKADNDKLTFTPREFQDLVFDMLDDILGEGN